jgi:hypothetical protein
MGKQKQKKTRINQQQREKNRKYKVARTVQLFRFLCKLVGRHIGRCFYILIILAEDSTRQFIITM